MWFTCIDVFISHSNPRWWPLLLFPFTDKENEVWGVKIASPDHGAGKRPSWNSVRECASSVQFLHPFTVLLLDDCFFARIKTDVA